MFSRNFISFLILIFIILTLFYYNILTQTFSESPLPSIRLHRNLSHYVVPEKHTSLVLPKAQCNSDAFVAVVVCSAVTNFKSRDAIRKTWGGYASRQRNIEIYFLLGKSTDSDINAAVSMEGSKYSDVIQEDFLDTYNNLTLKSVMLLKWVNQHCRHARYIMKTDDDMFIHVHNLISLLEDKGQPKLLLGCFLNDSTPNRDRHSKYYVPENLFPNQYYPPYLSGTGYVFSGDTVPGLFQASLEVDFFHLEDVFITGVCASRIGLIPSHDSRFLYKNDERRKDCCTLKSLITAHKISSDELLFIWKKCFQNVQPCPSKSYFVSANNMIVFFMIFIAYFTMDLSISLEFSLI